MIRPSYLSTVFLLGIAAALPAQSKKTEREVERDVERAAEQIGRTVERTVSQALRTVDRVLDKTFDKNFDRNLNRTIDRALEQSFDRSFDKSFDKSFEKLDRIFDDRSLDQIIEEALSQKLDKSIDRRYTDRDDADRHADQESARRRSGLSRLDDEDYQQGERIDTTFTFSRNGVVDLSSMSGDIVVTGWSRGEARVRASTERGRLRWHVSSSRLSVETETYRGRNGDTRYEVSVPEGARVILRSTSGDLIAKGTRGSVDAHTNSGDVDVTDATDAELHSLSGDITAARLRGDVEATTVGGSVDVQDVEARSIRLESTSGDVILTNARSKDVAASTVSGEVHYKGTIESGGQYEFHSHSGDVTLEIPSNVSARFSVETFSGELDAGGFPVTIQPNPSRRQRSRRLEFTLGGGDARVVAETFSGSVELRRDARR